MLEVIKKRRACRKFDSRIVEEAKIKEIVEAGLLAPSGMGRQTPVIIAISDKKLRDELSALNRSFMANAPEGVDPFYGAPVVLLVASNKDGISVHDGAATIENMLLEATNQGLASCWIHRAKEEIESPEGRKLLSRTGLNFDDYIGIGHVVIGYPDGYKAPEKKIKDGRAFYM
ncbi:MAG TPA: diguanylate cyclase [Spirochaetaceae bacterium]|nr:diguanylate cyclase [Spirochaetaceae bacterium]